MRWQRLAKQQKVDAASESAHLDLARNQRPVVEYKAWGNVKVPKRTLSVIHCLEATSVGHEAHVFRLDRLL